MDDEKEVGPQMNDGIIDRRLHSKLVGKGLIDTSVSS